MELVATETAQDTVLLESGLRQLRRSCVRMYNIFIEIKTGCTNCYTDPAEFVTTDENRLDYSLEGVIRRTTRGSSIKDRVR
jgi:hypothetical protein